MSLVAVALVFLSALFHATWNAIGKRSTHKIIFFWMAGAASCICVLPVIVVRWQSISATAWVLIGLSSVFEAVYLLLLSKAYNTGDMSLVYPISRGLVPLFVLLMATVWLGERMPSVGLAGIGLCVLAVYVLHLRSFGTADWFVPLRAVRQPVSRYALLSSIAVAVYSTIDKVGVQHTDPLLYTALIFWGYVVLLAPIMLQQRAEIAHEWQHNKRAIMLVGVLSAATYFVVTQVMRTSPISYISALRGISVVFGAGIGAVWLQEKITAPKLLGTGLMFAGTVLIAVAK